MLQSQWEDFSSFCNRWNDSHVWYPFNLWPYYFHPY
uniref:Uncharacterized protein n=1 Tax=Rhizophora mucronata TaxID=61149 RepID=A0A2P2KKK7_RHIMU